jgi:UDPglucose 6-dehydrogenase
MDRTKTIGIVGQGFVGTAVREELRKTFNIKAYDKFNDDLSVTFTKDTIIEDTPKNSIATLVEECDIIFVCVPTPMLEDGECDVSTVQAVVQNISKEAELQDRNVIAIIKSTVSPGTTEMLNKMSSKVGVVFSPEFLTEANSINDFKHQTRVILGIDYVEFVDPVRNIFEIGLPSASIIITSSKEAEMTKYTTNLFLATKVSFFNDIYTFCEHLGINYDNVIEATMHDPRIGNSHYLVPGPDGDRGFGGHCLKKDTEAILKIAQDMSIALPTVLGAMTTNTIVRTNKDWEKMEGRAVVKKAETPLNL